MLEAKVADTVGLCLAHNKVSFIGFLDERERGIAEKLVDAMGNSNYLFWGGWQEAERVMLGVFPDYQEPAANAFPLTAITVEFRRQDSLTHRDFLGAMLSHGIEREIIGDILVEEGRGVLFVREEMADYLLMQVEKIGRVGVTLRRGANEPFPGDCRLEEFSAVVASLRLDCVVAACTRLSREKANLLIQEGLVMLNHEAVYQPSRLVESGSKLSIRGKGRFLFDHVGKETKKGRLHIFMKKYR